MINYYLGDLLAHKDKFDYIAHGCNCFHLMGAGIAGQVSSQFPNTYLADIQNSIKGDTNKLGDFTYDKEDKILNLYTQYQPGPNVDYDAIRKVFRKLNKEFPGKHIAIPRIGCGIAGGDWNLVTKIISEECTNIDITVFLYAKDFDNPHCLHYVIKDKFIDGHKIFFQGLLGYIKDDGSEKHFKKVEELR